MGHCSIQVTVDLYWHLIPGGNKQAVDRMDFGVEERSLRRNLQPWRNRPPCSRERRMSSMRWIIGGSRWRGRMSMRRINRAIAWSFVSVTASSHRDSDKDTVERAAKILEVVNKVEEANSKISATAT